MSHYATLRDYEFDEDVEDLRGATLYGEGGQKLAKIQDVVFEHGSGEIRYLVANEGYGRRVLVPVDSVRSSAARDSDLDSELTKEDLSHLPAFDEKMLKHDKEWRTYMKLHRQALAERNKASRREYREEWTDRPVEHIEENAAHIITPVESAPRSSKVTPIDRRRRSHYVPDLTPRRLAPIFTKTAQTPDKLNMVPNVGHERGPAADYQTAGLGVKWDGYQEMIRRDLGHLQEGCEECERKRKDRIA